MMNSQDQSNDELARTLGRIEGQLEGMNKALFGNGQPGFVQNTEGRLNVLEELKNTIKGGFAAGSFLLLVIGGTTLYHIFFGTGK